MLKGVIITLISNTGAVGHNFAFDALKIWNKLPHDLRSAASVASFRKKLKTLINVKYLPPCSVAP